MNPARIPLPRHALAALLAVTMPALAAPAQAAHQPAPPAQSAPAPQAAAAQAPAAQAPAVQAPAAQAPAVQAADVLAADVADDATVRDAEGFVRATAGRPLVLPADHGSHPETRTEWWYLTGELRADSSRAADGAASGRAVAAGPESAPDSAPDAAPEAAFGFQATWFRRALVAELPAGRSPLATRDVLLFHGALTDVAAGSQSFREQSCRAYPPWAHAAPGALDVALLDSSLIDTGDGGARLSCRVGDGVLDARLDLSACAPLLHGESPGLSRKGTQPGQASWYYSLPRLPLRGTLRRPGRPDLLVSGHAWFDHEFGSSQLSAEQVGWDWFSVALDDGSDLMLYRMRLADGSADVTSSGTFRDADAGTAPGRYLSREQFTLAATGSWTSPHTGASYPSGWTLAVPDEQLLLTVQPLVADQELLTAGSTGVTYWEGLCRFRGTRAGRPVSGEGYVELVGYAGRFTERL